MLAFRELRHLKPTDYQKMPWKNGGGTTTELVIEPPCAELGQGRFLYRVSIAEVAVDGPFSTFAGYTRHILLLSGAGMTLNAGPSGTYALNRPFEPLEFSGDFRVEVALLGGPVRDFNVMVDRERAAATLQSRVVEARETVACGPGQVCIVHLVDGGIEDAQAGDTLVATSDLQLRPAVPSRIVVARIALISS